MSNLEDELKQLTDLITEKQGFLRDVEKIAHYRDKFKVVEKNVSNLINVGIYFEATEKTVLSHYPDGMGNKIADNNVAFHFNDSAIIKWLISVISLILEFKGSILKEELAAIKKEKK